MTEPNRTNKSGCAAIRSVKLPTDFDILAVPSLTAIVVLEVALSMTVSAIHCEHIDLDELPRYIAEGDHPPRTLALAQNICDRADDLLKILVAYRDASNTEITSMKTANGFPF